MSQPFTTTSQIVASYDYQDIIDGTGIITLYPFVARNNTGTIYRMDNRILGTELEGTGHAVTTTDTEVFNLDFDTKEFVQNRTIEGLSMLRLPLQVQPDVSNQIITATITINLYKYDGTTETLIGTSATTRLTETGSNFKTKITLIEVNCARTQIKRGEQVRLNIVLNAQITTGATDSCDIAIGHSPDGNTFTYDGPAAVVLTMTDTIMKLNLPQDLSQ